MEEEKVLCPYCGSETIKQTFHDRPCWICEDCECLFYEEDIERQKIREQVSWLLDSTDWEHPKKCDIVVGEWEAQGLSGLELPHIVKCFQIPGDGTMWFHCDGAVDENGDEAWMNFDDFDIHDLRVILGELEDNYYQDWNNLQKEKEVLRTIKSD